MPAYSKEGLMHSPEPNYLHVDLGKDDDGVPYPWHLYDYDSDRQIPVYEPALRGRLTEIKIRKGVYKNKEHFKVVFKVVSGATVWFIRTGVETTFARGVLLSLNEISPTFEHNPEFVFYAKPGDTAVYGSVYFAETMDLVPKEWDAEIQLLPIIQSLQAALGQEPQTLEQVRAEYDQRQQLRNVR